MVKIALFLCLGREHLTDNGSLVIKEISFPNQTAIDRAKGQHQALGDASEYYWCAKLVTQQLAEGGFYVQYKKISTCAGVYCIQYHPVLLHSVSPKEQ